MKKSFKVNFLIFVLLVLNFTFFSYAAFPDLTFTQSNFNSGQVDINFQSSSGLKVSLYVNNNYIGQKDSIAPQRDLYLTSDITDETIAVGQTLHIVNNYPGRIYLLNFSTGSFQSLSNGEYYDFRSYISGIYEYKDQATLTSAYITVQDELVQNNFTNINSAYLLDGQNKISFVYYSLLNNSKLGEKNFTFNYDKYPNKIIAIPNTNITQLSEVKINGSVTIANSPLFYVLNNNGTIGNLGQLRSVSLKGSTFSTTIGSLREGENQIRFISVDPVNNQIFNGEKYVNVFVDTITPKIQITSAVYNGQVNGKSEKLNADLSQEVFINGNSLKLNITTDAFNLTAQLNGRNTTYKVINDSLSFDLSLVKGQNNLTLIATDIAGNIAKEAHAIWFDNDAITLKNVTPKSGDTVHFFIQDFQGYVNKGDVEITAFAIPRNAKVWNPETNSEKSVTCQDYSFLGIRDLGQVRKTTSLPKGDVSYNPDDLQISLTSLISGKVTAKSGSDGKFKVENIILHEDSFTQSDVNNLEPKTQTNPKINNVKSLNQVCFVLSDKFGNTITRDISITLDNGNTMWRPGEITTMPNTIYAAEIEQTGNQRSGSGKVRFGVIARIQYIGGGQLTNVQGVIVSNDGSINSESKNARVVTSEMNYKVDPSTNEMILYFPVEVSPLGKKPLEYPSELNFHFQARLTYNVNDKSIPIDTANPVYFQTKVNVERPLDHSKWLTPSLIDGTLEFLNTSIKYTKKATEVMQIASVGGVLTCTGAKFYHAYKIAEIMATTQDEKEKTKAIAEADRQLYIICDRVACLNSPPKTDTLSAKNANSEGMVTIAKEQVNSGGTTSKLIIDNPLEYPSADDTGKIAGRISQYQINGECVLSKDANGVPTKGVRISGKVEKYSKDVSAIGSVADVTSTQNINNYCVEGKVNGDGTISFNSKTLGSLTFRPGSPNFDDTKCNFFGLDTAEGDSAENNWENSGEPGKSSSTSIISSVRCGCITDTYSHLKNYLKIQEGIQKCLIQAKLGNTKGSYCERIMSQAVCDIATNVVLPEVLQNWNMDESEGKDRNPAANFLTQMRKTDNAMSQRYQGSILSQAGLSTDQIMNKACVGAITGDWSVLTDSILTAIDKNEVEPVFGPPFPESRIQGYNPITGTLAINYRFTYGAISGGSTIRTTVELICDSTAPNGEYCDEGIYSSKDVINSEFKFKNLNVNKGGSVQDTVTITENKAKFWYNKIKLTHEYTIKNENKRVVQEFPIIHKSEWVAQCYFTAGTMGAGAGISCSSMFGEDSMISSFTIDKDKTRIVPNIAGATSSTPATLYPGNNLYLDLAYSSKNVDLSSGESISLAYMAICGNNNKNPVNLPKSGKSGPHLVELSSDELAKESGRKIVNLLEIPQVADTSTGSSVALVSTIQVTFDKSQYAIQFADSNGVGTDLPISKVYLKGSGGEVIADNLQQSFIAQNFNVNQANAKPNVQYLELNTNSLEGKTGFIVIEFSSPLSTSISTSVGTYSEQLAANGVDKLINYNLKTSFANDNTQVKSGSCQLKLRILPTSQATSLTQDNFDTYSVTSSNFTNVKSVDIISIPFSIQNPQSKDAMSIERFDLVGIYDGALICLEENSDETQSISYLYQNGANCGPNGVSLSYILSANGYGTVASPKNGISISNNCNSFNLDIDKTKKDAMIKQIKESTGNNAASSWVFGSSNSISGTLSYTANSGTKILNKKDIKVNFIVSENCAQYKINTGSLCTGINTNVACSSSNTESTTTQSGTTTTTDGYP